MDDKGSIILYTTPDGEAKIEVKLHDETVWLTLDQMAELFQRNKSTISRHMKNVLEEGELQPDSTVAFFATVQNEGNYSHDTNIKDLGKRWFAIMKMQKTKADEIIKHL